MRRWSILLPVLGVLSLVLVSEAAAAEQTPAEKLVAKLPPDVLAFIATSGGDALKPDFDQSSLGKIWHEQSVQTFYQQMKDQIYPLIQSNLDSAKDKQTYDILLRLVKATFTRPVVIAVCERPGAKADPIYGFLLADVGDRKAEIEAAFNQLDLIDPKDKDQVVTIDGLKMHRGTETSGPVHLWGFVGNYLLFSMNDPKGDVVRHLTAKSPATQPVSLNGLTQLPGTDDAMVLYVDTQRIGRLVATEADKTPDDRPTTEKVRQALQILGLFNVQSLAFRMGFAGPDLTSDAVIAVPEPRHGLFSLLKPVDVADLKAVPANVTGVQILHFDLAGLYDLIMTTVKTVAPKEAGDLDQAVAEFEQKAGFRVRADILASIGGPMISYSMPATNPINMMVRGGVMRVKLNDPARFEKAMVAVEKYVTANTAQVQMATQMIDNHAVHLVVIPQLAMAQITPAWAVAKDQLIIATNADLVRTALAPAAGPGFVVPAKDLPQDLISLQYTNERVAGQEGIQALQQMWPMLATVLQENKQMKLPLLLPPAADVVRHLGDEIDYTWFTPQGLRSHNRSHGPAITSGAVAVAGGSMGVAILLPALGNARETAKRSASASNLRQIYLACYEYSSKHAGKLPADLQELVKANLLKPELLKSPRQPAGFSGPGYIYVSGLDADVDPRFVVLYENPALSGEGLNVCYADGHVAWTKPEEFKTQLAATYKHLGKPMPEVKFAPSREEGGLDLGNLFGSNKTQAHPDAGATRSQVNLDKKIPFKCTSCNHVERISIRDLQKMVPPAKNHGPMMGPMTLDCPKCHKTTLTQAVECPKCATIFVMKMDAKKGLFDDRCPQCGAGYAKAWQEKYRSHEASGSQSPTTSPATAPARSGRVNLDKRIPFKCTGCEAIVWYTIRDLQQITRQKSMGPMMGPMILDCPKCKKKALTQAVECPQCQFVFVMRIDPAHNKFNDRCPNCHESYAKAWQEKYRSHGAFGSQSVVASPAMAPARSGQPR